jgi:hypothetical protein
MKFINRELNRIADALIDHRGYYCGHSDERDNLNKIIDDVRKMSELEW